MQDTACTNLGSALCCCCCCCFHKKVYDTNSPAYLYNAGCTLSTEMVPPEMSAKICRQASTAFVFTIEPSRASVRVPSLSMTSRSMVMMDARLMTERRPASFLARSEERLKNGTACFTACTEKEQFQAFDLSPHDMLNTHSPTERKRDN